MKKNTFNKIGVDVYEEILDNGLRIYLVPLDRNEIHARMTVLFGGSILEFKMNDEFIKVPGGLAHFLEHKMFEKEDGIDPMTIYERNGASANAFTTEFVTAYHFTGSDYFYDNLKTLLKSVHEPYFTDENVLKEKGIISQEKKRDLDDPLWITYDKALENTFHNLDVKNTVLGSLDDINSITKEDLYNCYNTFYHPSNMVLTICGGMDIDKTIKFIKDFYKDLTFEKRDKPEVKEKSEPKSVVCEKEVIYKDVNAKEMFINYKISKPRKNYLDELYYGFLLNMKFGGLSGLSDIVLKDENILSMINYYNVNELSDFDIFSFNVTVKDDTEKVINLIDNKLKDQDYDEKIFNLIKKTLLNSVLLSMENVKSVCNFLANQISVYGNINYDVYSQIQNLSFEQFKETVKDLNFDNRAIVILEKDQ